MSEDFGGLREQLLDPLLLGLRLEDRCVAPPGPGGPARAAGELEHFLVPFGDL